MVVNDLGGSVVGSGSDASASERVVAEIRGAGGEAVVNADSVSSPEGATRIIQAALDAFGGLDIVVNNAGILRDSSFGKMSADEFDAVVAVHLRGSFLMCRQAWPVLRERGYGRIINTSSNSGLIGNFGQSNYGAAKMGIVGLTRVLAIEGARYGIKVNAIAPAARTRMTEGVLGSDQGRILDPSRVAPAVAWLAHEECPITGEVISAGGGRVARYFIGLTEGYFSADLDVEGVAAHWDIIRDIKAAFVPTDPSEEMDQIMKNWK